MKSLGVLVVFLALLLSVDAALQAPETSLNPAESLEQARHKPHRPDGGRSEEDEEDFAPSIPGAQAHALASRR